MSGFSIPHNLAMLARKSLLVEFGYFGSLSKQKKLLVGKLRLGNQTLLAQSTNIAGQGTNIHLPSYLCSSQHEGTLFHMFFQCPLLEVVGTWGYLCPDRSPNFSVNDASEGLCAHLNTLFIM